MSAREAFFTICNEAKPAKGCYVSLYVRVPYWVTTEETPGEHVSQGCRHYE